MSSNPQLGKPPVIVISGPSGSGKTTLCKRLAGEFGLFFSVSHTTRPRRSNEMNGRDYFFVTKEEFEEMVRKGEFLEWANVYDNLYGTAKDTVEGMLAKGHGVLLDVDTHGAINIRKCHPEALLLFIRPPSMDDLRKRLEGRGSETPETIARRLAEAASEEATSPQYDHIVVNDDVERAYQELRKYVADPPSS